MSDPQKPQYILDFFALGYRGLFTPETKRQSNKRFTHIKRDFKKSVLQALKCFFFFNVSEKKSLIAYHGGIYLIKNTTKQ